MKRDEKIQTIVLIIAFVVALVGLTDVILHPVRYTDLPLEKRIQYERMIFP